MDYLNTTSISNSSDFLTPDVEYVYSDRTRTVDLGIMITMLILGVIGNPLVLILYAKQKRKMADYFVVNMVIADCFVVLCYCPLIGNIVERQNVLGERACQLFGFLSLTMCVSSLYSLTALAVCRFVQVCHPPQYNAYFTHRYCIGYCAAIWVVCIALSLLPFAGWGGYFYAPETVFCMLDYRASLSYTLFVYIGAEGASITLTVVSYSKLFLKLRESGQKMAAHISKEGKARRYQAICSMMLSAFFIASWSPYCIVCLLDISIDQDAWLIKYSTWLGLSNSALNGFMYILINKHYRLTLIRLLRVRNRVHIENSSMNSVRSRNPIEMAGSVNFPRQETKMTPIHS